MHSEKCYTKCSLKTPNHIKSPAIFEKIAYRNVSRITINKFSNFDEIHFISILKLGFSCQRNIKLHVKHIYRRNYCLKG